MQNSSKPNSAGLSKPQKRFLKKGLLTFAACMALADVPLSVTDLAPSRPSGLTPNLEQS